MDSDLVTIRRFHFLGEAHVVRGLLESAGIPCFVANQITSTQHSAFGVGGGAVFLQVRRSDVGEAEDLLQQAQSEQAGSENNDAEDRPPQLGAMCPVCSLGVVSAGRSWRECLNCGYRWEKL